MAAEGGLSEMDQHCFRHLSQFFTLPSFTPAPIGPIYLAAPIEVEGVHPRRAHSPSEQTKMMSFAELSETERKTSEREREGERV